MSSGITWGALFFVVRLPRREGRIDGECPSAEHGSARTRVTNGGAIRPYATDPCKTRKGQLISNEPIKTPVWMALLDLVVCVGLA